MDQLSKSQHFKPKLFIHIPKNAGMTVRDSPEFKPLLTALSKDSYFPDGYGDRVRSTMRALGDHSGLEHARWIDVKSELTDKYQSFAVIRNPWSRVVSRYFFAKKVIEVEQKVSRSYADVRSLEHFIEERHMWGNREYMWHRAVRGWNPAYDYVTDHQGNIRCDILRFEHIDTDLPRYFKILNMPRARNVTGLNKGSYTDLYNKKTIQIIADWYEKDIETWGYDFASGPTRNTLYA